MIKHCVDLNLTVFGTRNYGCIIKAIGVFSFPPQINNSVTPLLDCNHEFFINISFSIEYSVKILDLKNVLELFVSAC